MTRYFAFVSLLIILMSGAAQADFAAGLKAQQTGDFETALKEWSKDAEAGNKHAQFNIAELFRQGKGASKSMEQAFKWYLRAAEQDVIEAQRNVGIMYGRAIGVALDDVESFKWLSIASAKGDIEAKKALGFMKKRIMHGPDKDAAKKIIGEAQFRAASWEPKIESSN